MIQIYKRLINLVSKLIAIRLCKNNASNHLRNKDLNDYENNSMLITVLR